MNKNIIKKDFLMALTTNGMQNIINEKCKTKTPLMAFLSTYDHMIDSRCGLYKENKIREIYLSSGFRDVSNNFQLSNKPDLIIENNDYILVGEIKQADQHDSGKIQSIASKLNNSIIELEHLTRKEVKGALMFISDFKKSHKKFYENEQNKFKTYYGEDIFSFLKNKREKYNSLMQDGIANKFDNNDLNYDNFSIDNFSKKEIERIVQKLPNRYYSILSPNSNFKNNINSVFDEMTMPLFKKAYSKVKVTC